ncbi:MAG: FtsX-like permease family protein, partial [Pseudomonadota bacterium]
SLTRELAGRLPQNAPSFFFLDVAKQEADRFREVLRVEAPQAEAETAPMLRGRIVAVKGVPAAEVQAGPDAAWALNGDRGLTFADAVPAGSKVTEGTWWPADYVGPPLVSLEENIARGLGLGIGDTLTVNVLGRPIEATVGSLRSVDWGTLSINFVLLYSPNTLSAAPFNYVMTLTWPGAPSMAKEAEVLKAVDRAFPEVTAIRVRDAIDQAGKLIARILTAVRGLGGLTLFVGAIVLAGAITTTQRRRIRQGVLLKTLGASPARVLRIGMTEFALLAFATGVVALMLGTLGAWLVTTQVMDVVFTFTVRSVIEALGIALAITLVLGGIALWRTLQVRPVPYLRAG